MLKSICNFFTQCCTPPSSEIQWVVVKTLPNGDCGYNVFALWLHTQFLAKPSFIKNWLAHASRSAFVAQFYSQLQTSDTYDSNIPIADKITAIIDFLTQLQKNFTLGQQQLAKVFRAYAVTLLQQSTSCLSGLYL
jgi:hypothetical protein